MGFPIIHQPAASCWPPFRNRRIRNSKTLKYYGTEEPSSQYKRGEIMVTIVSRGPPLASESTTTATRRDATLHNGFRLLAEAHRDSVSSPPNDKQNMNYKTCLLNHKLDNEKADKYEVTGVQGCGSGCQRRSIDELHDTTVSN